MKLLSFQLFVFLVVEIRLKSAHPLPASYHGHSNKTNYQPSNGPINPLGIPGWGPGLGQPLPLVPPFMGQPYQPYQQQQPYGPYPPSGYGPSPQQPYGPPQSQP